MLAPVPSIVHCMVCYLSNCRKTTDWDTYGICKTSVHTNHKSREQELIFNTVAGDYTEWGSAPIGHADTADRLGEPRSSTVSVLYKRNETKRDPIKYVQGCLFLFILISSFGIWQIVKKWPTVDVVTCHVPQRGPHMGEKQGLKDVFIYHVNSAKNKYYMIFPFKQIKKRTISIELYLIRRSSIENLTDSAHLPHFAGIQKIKEKDGGRKPMGKNA